MRSALVSLDVIQMASPCKVSWDAMRGDDQVRFCSQCHLNVYDLSAMSRADAQAFVNAYEGRTCIRFLRREDGTILTKDWLLGVVVPLLAAAIAYGCLRMEDWLEIESWVLAYTAIAVATLFVVRLCGYRLVI